MAKIEATVWDTDEDGGEIEYDVIAEYEHHKGCKGHCDKYGAPEEPDETSYIEITRILKKDGKEELDITDDLEEQLIEKVWEDINNQN